MSERTVKQIVDSQKLRMGDSRFYQPLPTDKLDMLDPFLLLHHWGPNHYESGDEVMSFDAHPHKGFEPVTFVFQGEVFHRDSLGNNSVIKSGGVQWMTSGRGIVHAEGPSKEFQERGGTLELVQLWINLPKKYKQIEPRYQGFQPSEIPTLNKDDGRVSLNLFSGELDGQKGPAQSITGIRSITITLDKHGEIDFETLYDCTPLLYVLEGDLSVNGRKAGEHQLVTFNDDGTVLSLTAHNSTLLLLVEGEPLNEPVVQQGPFVVNTKREIWDAMQEYQNGKMGVLE